MVNARPESENAGSLNSPRIGKFIGLIVAAGYSSRMKGFKPLLPIGDVTAIERVSASLKQAGVDRIIVVTGFQRELLAHIFERENIREVFNPTFEQGMFTSIQAGIKAAMDEGVLDEAQLDEATLEGFFLMPVDCPLIPPHVIELIEKEHETSPDSFIVPCYQGKKGHPLFIPAQYSDEILSYDGDGGLKAITNKYDDKMIRLEVGIEAVVLDMDTPEGYEEILDYFEGGTPIEHQLKGKRIIFVRHGEIKQNKEKIFLGQTDIALSDKGKEQASNAAVELSKLNITTNRIYTSDLSRAVETGEIIKAYFCQEFGEEKFIVIKEPKLREMSLGEWDGRFISEIKALYPQEYKKRGEKLLTYKYGNDSENFYDLRYRALKGLRNIINCEKEACDAAKDIIIVAHSGVINVLLSSLKHEELGDIIENTIPNGGIIICEI